MTKWNQIKSEIETTRNMYSKGTKTYLNVLFTVLFLIFFFAGVFTGSLNTSSERGDEHEEER